MSPKWQIILDRRELRRKVAFLEGRARGAGAGGGPEEVEFSLVLYPDQVSLNVPATTLGREWIADLTAILGAPKLPATVKCSCSWGQGMVGAMLLVLWDLPAPHAALLLRNLHAFLGSALPS
jgi:hypothetical protein